MVGTILGNYLSLLWFRVYLYCNLLPIVIFLRLNSNFEDIWLHSTSWIQTLRCLTAVNHLFQLNDNEVSFTRVTFFSPVDRIRTSFRLFFSSHRLIPFNQEEKKVVYTQLTVVDSMQLAVSTNFFVLLVTFLAKGYILGPFLFNFFPEISKFKLKLCSLPWFVSSDAIFVFFFLMKRSLPSGFVVLIVFQN